MKHELLQLRIDADTLTALKDATVGVPELTVSQFVREAIREKLARDVYSVESVPTMQSIRQGIVPPVSGVSSFRERVDAKRETGNGRTAKSMPSISEAFKKHQAEKAA